MGDNNGTSDSKQKIGYPDTENPEAMVPEGIQLDNIASATSVIVSYLVHDSNFYNSLALYSKILRLASIIDSLVCVLYLWGGVEFMIFLVAFPLLGYCAAKHYHKNLIIGYGIYLVIKIIYRLVLFAMNQTVSYAISHGTIIFLELWVLVIIIRFFRGLSQLSKIERKCLRMAEYGYINQFSEGQILEA